MTQNSNIYKYHGKWWLYKPDQKVLAKISKQRAVSYLSNSAVAVNDEDKAELTYYASRFMGHGMSAWQYGMVSDYLSWVKKCFVVVRRGGRVQINWAGPELDGAGWQREFWQSLDRRINLKTGQVP